MTSDPKTDLASLQLFNSYEEAKSYLYVLFIVFFCLDS